MINMVEDGRRRLLTTTTIMMCGEPGLDELELLVEVLWMIVGVCGGGGRRREVVRYFELFWMIKN